MKFLRLSAVLLLLPTHALAQADDAGAPPPPPEDAAAAPSAEPDPGPSAADPEPGASDAGVEGESPAAEPAAPEELDPFGELAATPAPTAVVAPEDALFHVEGVEVVGKLSRAEEAPGSAYVLDEKTLEKFDFDDATQVLTQVPGVYVRTEDGYGLRPNIGMRGADSDRSKKVTLLEDGILFGPAPYSAPAAYYFPMITRMTGVTVLKGAPTIAYGPQTIGGVLDLRTRAVPEKGPVAGLDASFGNTFYDKAHVYGGYGEKYWGVLAEGLHVSSRGFKHLDGGGNTGFSKQEAMLKARVNTDPIAHVYQRAELKLGYGHEDSHETYTGLTDSDFRNRPLRRYAGSALDNMKWWRTQAELAHTLGVGDHFELRTAVYRHDYNRLWRRLDGFLAPGAGPGGYTTTGTPGMFDALQNPDDPINAAYIDLLRGNIASDDAQGNGRALLQAGNHRSFVSQGVQTTGRYDFRTGKVSHVITAGLRLHQDSIDRFHSARALTMEFATDAAGNRVGDYARPVIGPSLAPLADNDVTSLAFAAHAIYELHFFDVTLSPGIRNEFVNSTYTEHATGMRTSERYDVPLLALGALYDVTERVALLAGVQQGMSPVAPAAMASSKPERANNYEAGARYHDRRGQGSAVGFVSDYDRIVAPCDDGTCSSAAEGQSFAGKRALVAGVELGADYVIPLPQRFELPLRAAYTFTHAEFLTAFQTNYQPWSGGRRGGVKSGDLMPYIPPHQLSAGAGVAWDKRVTLDLQLTFMDRMREVAGQGALTPGLYTDRYAMLDAVASYTVGHGVKVYLRGDNLTNNQPIAARRPFGARPVKPLLVQVGVKWEL